MTKRIKNMPASEAVRATRDISEADAAKNSNTLVDTETATDAVTKFPSKTDRVLELMRSDDGATLDQIVEATGWLPHTARAMLTDLRKKGHNITSTKSDGPRVYHIIDTQGEVT